MGHEVIIRVNPKVNQNRLSYKVGAAMTFLGRL
jgi:hypothetical protein